jgi:hypothetical protein
MSLEVSLLYESGFIMRFIGNSAEKLLYKYLDFA